jgi:hypothetical protein
MMINHCIGLSLSINMTKWAISLCRTLKKVVKVPGADYDSP